jgi:hypothetical protein
MPSRLTKMRRTRVKGPALSYFYKHYDNMPKKISEILYASNFFLPNGISTSTSSIAKTEANSNKLGNFPPRHQQMF